jgi:hypothetical protein
MNRIQKIKSLIEGTDPSDLQAHQVLVNKIYREVCSVPDPRDRVRRRRRAEEAVAELASLAGLGTGGNYGKIESFTERLLIALDEGRLV